MDLADAFAKAAMVCRNSGKSMLQWSEVIRRSMLLYEEKYTEVEVDLGNYNVGKDSYTNI